MDQNSIYLISNACAETFPSNTLTNFTNKLPVTIELDNNDNWEVGIESIGMSCLYRNVIPPQNKLTPSLFITECASTGMDRYALTSKCRKPNRNELECYDEQVHLGNPSSHCNWWKYFIEDKQYSTSDIEKLSEKILKETIGVKLTYEDQRLCFKINVNPSTEKFHPTFTEKAYWILLHQSMKDSFNFHSNVLWGYNYDSIAPYATTGIYLVEIGGERYSERPIIINGEQYYAYFISRKIKDSTAASVVEYTESVLKSDIISLESRHYPKLIKVVCDSIQPQILNSQYSKDLLIFSPDFSNTQNYFYHELECVDYIPLLNNNLSNFHIQLLDENNQQLQLLSGHATILKLNFRKMTTGKRSFNIRLTSSVSSHFPHNTHSKFKVKIPSPIQLDNTWNVSVNSINCPVKFTTFLTETESRTVTFQDSQTNERSEYSFSDKKTYSITDLVNELNYFLETKNIGKAALDKHGRLELLIKTAGTFEFGIFLAKILGCEKPAIENEGIKTVVIKVFGNHGFSYNPGTGETIVKFVNTPNIEYLKPNYFIIYSNIVKSSIIGGGYGKILRVVPLRETKLNYAIMEFKRQEFYPLENDEINIIEIQLRSHDGRFVNFFPNQDIILNLEFSNYSEE